MVVSMAIRKVVCIEPGPISTRISKIDYGKPDGRIRKSIEFATPEGAVEDGYVRDRDSYLYTLKREMKAGKFKKGFLVFTLNSSRVLSREVTLPLVSYRMLPGLIESGKEEYFPVDVSNHEIAYTVLEVDKKNKTRRLMLYAVPKKLVEQYIELADKLKCKLVAIDFAGNSVSQWIRRCARPVLKENLNILMQMNDQNTLVTIIENGSPVLQRNVNFGTRNVLDAVKGLYPEEELSYEEAYDKFVGGELIKESYDAPDLPMTEEMAFAEWEHLNDVRRQITEVLRPLILNITRMIEFYATKNKTAQVEMIRVMGNGLRLEGLIPLMNNEIGLPVEAMESGLDKQKKRRVRVRRSSDLVTGFGAALSPIYYIGKKFHDGESYAAVAVCILILTALCSYYARNVVLEAQEECLKAQDVKNELIEARDSRLWVRTEKADYEKFMLEQSEILTMHEETFTYNEQLKKAINQLEEDVPASTIIHSMSSTGNTLTLSVSVDTKADAEKLLYQLQRFPYFSEVTISGITESEPEPGLTNVSFSLNCTYTVPGEEETEAELQEGK